MAIDISGNMVQFVDEVVKFVDDLNITLSWGLQVTHITRKINKDLFGLKLIGLCIIQVLRKRLVVSLVLPHLDYCSVLAP